MERIVYRKTLDVHKSGVQFMLQGFETADKLSRVIEVSLMASGDAIDFPLERIVAMMYVTSPGADEPSINPCTIKDNKVVYEVLPIVTEGITEMQIKLIETSIDGAKSVLASPTFAVEVTKSGASDEGEEQKATFSAIEEFISKAEVAYGKRLERIELTSDCIFKAYYADETYYETDVLKRLFMNGNVLLSESFAHGNTGVRAGEDTDNSMYYSNVARSEALNAKNIMENSEELLEEVKLHGMYTAFSIDFTTGEVEYVSPSFKFNINKETGELDAIGQAYSFNDEIGRVVTEWLGEKGVVLADLQAISSKHGQNIAELQNKTQKNETAISTYSEQIKTIDERIVPINKGGTGATTAEEARKNLNVPSIDFVKDYQQPWDLNSNIGKIFINAGSLSIINRGGIPTEKTYSLSLINSGTVRLHFEPTQIWSGCKAATIEILHNNKRLYYVEGDDNFISMDIDISDVKKGDKIYFKLYLLAWDVASDDNYETFAIRNIGLFANYATPYKYFDIVLEGEI